MARTPVEQTHSPAFARALPKVALVHHGRTIFGPMKEWKAREHLPPVLLLTGQPGIGKRQVAHFLAQWIFCETKGFQPTPSLGLGNLDSPTLQLGHPDPSGALDPSDPLEMTPCGECLSCRKFLQGNEVDVTEITPETEEDSGSSGTLKIDQFRKLKASMGFRAHENRYRIIVIPDAERMTPQAANSVLKLLEETPPGWLFFLTANDAALLLPTVVSRCQTLRLKPFSREEIQELLKSEGVEPRKQKVCAEVSQGSWTRALAFAEDEIWEQRKVLFQFLQDPGSVLQTIIDWTSQKPSHFGVLVDLLEQFTADLIRWSSAPGNPDPENYSWIHADGTEQLVAHARRVLRQFGNRSEARRFWIDRAARLAQSRQEALTPVNRKLLIQDILFPWVGVHA